MQQLLSALWMLFTAPGFLTFWTAVGALSTAAGTAVVLLAASGIYFNAWVKALEIFTQPDFTAARRVVLARYRVPRNTPWTSPDKEQAVLVCRKMDEFAQLLPFQRRRLVLRTYYDPIGKCWDVLEEIVKKQRVADTWPEKWTAFERLGKASMKIIKSKA